MSGVTAATSMLPVMGAMVHASTRVGTAAELASNLTRVHAGIAEVEGLIDATVHGLATPTLDDIAAIGARTAAPAVRDHGGVLTEQARAAASQVGMRRPIGNLPAPDPLPTDWPLHDLVAARSELARLAANLELVARAGGPEVVPIAAGHQAIEGAGRLLRTAMADDGIAQLDALQVRADAWAADPGGVAPEVMGREVSERLATIRDQFRMGGLPRNPAGVDQFGIAQPTPGAVRRAPQPPGGRVGPERLQPAAPEQVRAAIDDLRARLQLARTTPDPLQERAMEASGYAGPIASARDELAGREPIRTGMRKAGQLLQLRREVAGARSVAQAIRALDFQSRMSGVWRVTEVAPQLEQLLLDSANRIEQARAAAPAVDRLAEVDGRVEDLLGHLRLPTTKGEPFTSAPMWNEGFIANRVDLAEYALQHTTPVPRARHLKAAPQVAADAAIATIDAALAKADAAAARLLRVQDAAAGKVELPGARDDLLAAERDLRSVRSVLARDVDPSTLASFDEAIAVHADAADGAHGAYRRWHELRLPQRGALARARVSIEMAREELRFHLDQAPAPDTI